MEQTYFIDVAYAKNIMHGLGKNRLKDNERILATTGITAGLDQEKDVKEYVKFLTTLYHLAEECKDKTKVNLPSYYGLLSMVGNRLIHFYTAEELFDVSNTFLGYMESQLDIVKHYPGSNDPSIDWEANLFNAFIEATQERLVKAEGE